MRKEKLQMKMNNLKKITQLKMLTLKNNRGTKRDNKS